MPPRKRQLAKESFQLWLREGKEKNSNIDKDEKKSEDGCAQLRVNLEELHRVLRELYVAHCVRFVQHRQDTVCCDP